MVEGGPHATIHDDDLISHASTVECTSGNGVILPSNRQHYITRSAPYHCCARLTAQRCIRSRDRESSGAANQLRKIGRNNTGAIGASISYAVLNGGELICDSRLVYTIDVERCP